MKPKIKNVRAVEKYKLFVQFEDGVEGILDLSHLAGKGVFASWENGNNFFDVFVNDETNAITWPRDIDIDSYNAYFSIKGITPEEYFKQQDQCATHL